MHLRFARTTHRWRGENVSTAEVEATVSNFLELQVKQYCNNKVKSIAFKEFSATFFVCTRNIQLLISLFSRMLVPME